MSEEKEILPGVKGEKEQNEDAARRNVRQSPSSEENKNLPLLAPKDPRTRSRQTASIQPAINFTISRLSLGQPVSEQDVFENSTSRYRRSESLMVLREVHRRYPRQTILALRQGPGAGMWVLLPVRRRS